MLVKTFGSAVHGVEAMTITIEVNWMETGVGMALVGLPDSAVKESLQRVESAMKTNHFSMPRTRVVVNLAPDEVREATVHVDPAALGLGARLAYGAIKGAERGAALGAHAEEAGAAVVRDLLAVG